MSNYRGFYQGFDVMDQREHWDDHTRSIVEERLSKAEWQVLSLPEVIALHAICATLLAEDRDEILTYVVRHFDERIAKGVGEAQRARGVPPEPVLVREGLRALHEHCVREYGCLFAALGTDARLRLLDQLGQGAVHLEADGVKIPSRAFFTKLLNTAVEACYSHPDIWSEIGYAGPAYPRGYVRSERGLTDPWEARRTDAQP